MFAPSRHRASALWGCNEVASGVQTLSWGDIGFMLAEPIISEHTLNGALVVFIIALAGLTWGTRRNSSQEGSSLALWCTLAFGSLSLITFEYIRWISVGLSFGSALTYWRASQHGTVQFPHPSRASILFFSASSYLALAFLLLYRLGTNYHIPLVWEGSIILHYLTELKTFDIWQALGGRLLWMEGLRRHLRVSGGREGLSPAWVQSCSHRKMLRFS